MSRISRIPLAGVILLSAATGCGYVAAGAIAISMSRSGAGSAGPGNTEPVVSLTTPSGGVSDLVTIPFTVIDLQWDPVDVVVEFSVGGGPFQPATQAAGAGSSGTYGLETTGTGLSYTFVWNSIIDIGSVNQSDVVIQVTPVETFRSLWGDSALTEPFTVLNAYVATVAGGAVGSGLNFPNGVAVDSGTPGDPADDVIYVADTFNNRILRHEVGTGTTTTFAGTGEPGFDSDDVPAAGANLNLPFDLAIDASGHLLICDSGNSRIRLVNRITGFISTIAGGGVLVPPDIGDGGLAIDCALQFPTGIALDASDNLYIADREHHVVRIVGRQPTPITVAGVTVQPSFIETFAGNGSGVVGGPTGDGGPADAAAVPLPLDVAVDGQGTIFITQPEENRVRVVNPGPSPITVAGVGVGANAIETLVGLNGIPGFGGDGGPPPAADVREPSGLAIDANDNLYIADATNNRLRVVNTTASPLTIGSVTVDPATINTVAGVNTDGPPGDGGPASQANLSFPTRPAFDVDGNILIAEGGGNSVRVVNTGGQPLPWGAIVVDPGAIDTLPIGLEEDEPRLGSPARVVVDDDGNIYFTDILDPDLGSSEGNRIYRVDEETGAMTVVAGTGGAGPSGDGGPAVNATLNYPADLVLDDAGNLLIADTFNNRVRAINNGDAPITIAGVPIAPGTIETVAGTGPEGYGGDDGPPTSALLAGPIAVDFDGYGNIYICEQLNHVVRVINTEGADIDRAGTTIAPGTIKTIVGDGSPGSGGDGGPAVAARLDTPLAMAVDWEGSLYISDSHNFRIRVVNSATWDMPFLDVMIPAGEIQTVVGTGSPGSSGDGGPAVSAQISVARDVVLDDMDNLWIVDSFNHRVRLVNGQTAMITRGWMDIDPGNIDTVVGTGRPGFNGDLELHFSSTLNQPTGLGLIWGESPVIADTSNGIVRLANFFTYQVQIGPRVIDPDYVGIVAGDPSTHGNRLVVAPTGLVQDASGQIVFADTLAGNNHSHRIFRLDPLTRAMAVLGGGGVPGFGGDNGPVGSAKFDTPEAVAIDGSGNLFIADSENHVIRAVNGGQSPATIAGIAGIQPEEIVTIAGVPTTAGYNGNGISATTAQLDHPSGVAAGPAGEVYISDTSNHQIRIVDASGTISLLAGNDPVGSGTLPGEFDGPTGLHLDPFGTLYVADTLNNRIQTVDTGSGFAAVVTGDAGGQGGFNGDGVPPANILLDGPRGVALDGGGNIFVVDTGNHRLLVDNRQGVDITVAGTLIEAGLVRKIAGTHAPGFNGDTLPPAATALAFPTAVLIDPNGDIYITDTGNRRVRRFAR